MIKRLLKYYLAFSIILVATLGLPQTTYAAGKFFLSPSSGSYKPGDTITVNVMIDSGGTAINAGEGEVFFSSDLLDYQSVSTAGSTFTFWTSGPSGSSSGVSFSGGLSNPGYSGSSGKILSITFKAKKAGIAAVTVSGSKILANDGSGTNIYGGGGSGQYTISDSAAAARSTKSTVAAPTVKSSSHPDPDKWYNGQSVSLSWSSNGAKAYVYTFDQSATTNPDATDSTSLSTTYTNVAEGISYFHVKAKTDSGYTTTTHFRVQIDITPPEEFPVSLDQNDAETDPAPKATFEAKDALSGVDHYEVKIDGGTFVVVKSGDRLPRQKPGNHVALIRAIDRAGNIRETTVHYTIVGIDPPVIVDWTKSVPLLTPVNFIGRSLPDDTIFVYLGPDEVAKFLAKDKQIADSHSAYSKYKNGLKDGEVLWEYNYTGILYPGTSLFRFSRTNSAGAESAKTDPYGVFVNASTVEIWGHVFPTNLVMAILLLAMSLLLLIIMYQWVRIRRITALCAVPIVGAARKIKDILRGVDKKVAGTIDKDIPDQALTEEQVEKVKHRLKDDVHHLIDEEEERLQ